MANSATSTALAVIVTLAVAGTGGYMVGARSAGPSDSKPVATVNGQAILRDAVYERMASQRGAELVERMIDEVLVDQLAKAAGITAPAAEVDAELAKLKERMGGEQKFNAALEQYGMTLDMVKDDQRHRILLTKLISREIQMDDAALKKFFDENFGQFDKKEVHSRHILMKTEEEAKQIKSELDKGADFAALAKEKSTDPSAKQNGGDLGSNKRGRMVPEFDNVVFSLKKGEISQPFQTQFGWHVAQVLDAKGESPTFEAAKAEVQEAYIQEQVQERMKPWIDEQKSKAKITNTLVKEKEKS